VQNIISKQKIESDSTIIYKAGTEIVLEEGFHAKPGSNFWASIEELDCNDTKSMSSFSPGDEENGTEDNHYLLSQNQIQHTINLFPNPNTGTFQLESNFPLSDIGNLKIVNLLGAPVYETQNLTSNTIQMPASAMGQYFVVIILKDGSVVTQKMMIVK
jgi:hypothetical protein